MLFDPTRIYRVKAIAHVLDISPSTIYRAIDTGALDALKIAGAFRVRGEAVERYLAQCRRDACEATAANRTSTPAND